jgi:hypothetical protein
MDKWINRLTYSWIKSINVPVSATGNVSDSRLTSQVGRLREVVCVFVRLALRVVMQNDEDIVGVVLLYLCPVPATGTKTASTGSSTVPGDGRAPVCIRGVQYVAGK